ncbi:MAG: hypothetical protein MRY83_11770, partial [Flavobacteriales bacterium]|nr:hypothetical protein [Flavobacteriales bacterium]
MNFKKILIRVFTFLVAYLALVNVVLKNQEYYGDFNWRTSLWSDQAGYYSYNPATFIYDFEIDSFPLKAAVNTGVGFRNKNGKFFTRYTYGVAFLQSPFFLAVHYYNKSKSLDTDGFSGNYHRIPILSGVFYLMLAFIILFRILRRQYSAIVSIISLIIIFTGTNLYFYFLNYNGFSHIYSLFLFTLFSSLALKYRDKEHVFTLYLLAFIFSFCVLIRPTSIIIAVALFMFWNKNTWKSLWRNLSIIRIVILLVFAVLPFIPQFAYWYFYSGKLLYYSYGDEGFKYLFNPQLLKTWFAPKNGVLPYTPIFIPLLIIWILRLRSDKTALPTLGIFILISYFSAAWHLYHFGCGYGNRNLIEYGVF